VFQKRSKSSTLTVDRIMAFVLLWTSSIELCRVEQRADERYYERPCRAIPMIRRSLFLCAGSRSDRPADQPVTQTTSASTIASAARTAAAVACPP
jgi:hypothetical protein